MEEQRIPVQLWVVAKLPWWAQLWMALGRSSVLPGTLVLGVTLRWEPSRLARRAGLAPIDVPVERIRYVNDNRRAIAFDLVDPSDWICIGFGWALRGREEPLGRWLTDLGFEQRQNPVEPGSIAWRRPSDPWPWQ